MLQVLGVLLASVCLGSSGEVLRGQTTQDSGAEHRRLQQLSTDSQTQIAVVVVFAGICCIISVACSCLTDCREESEKKKAAEEAENAARKLAQKAAVQDVAEAVWEADFFGPHDPGQRTEILTQRLLGTGADFSQRDASDQAKRLLAKHSHEAAWICWWFYMILIFPLTFIGQCICFPPMLLCSFLIPTQCWFSIGLSTAHIRLGSDVFLSRALNSHLKPRLEWACGICFPRSLRAWPEGARDQKTQPSTTPFFFV